MTRLINTLLISLLCSFGVFSQSITVDKIPADGILLKDKWMFHTGNSTEWKKNDFYESGWVETSPTRDVMTLEVLKNNATGWFKLELEVGEALRGKTFALSVKQTGSTRIYLNRQLIGGFGTFSTDTKPANGFDPFGETIGLSFTDTPVQELLVYLEKPPQRLVKQIFYNNPALFLKILNIEDTVRNFHNGYEISLYENFMDIGKVGMAILLCCYYVWVFILDKKNKGYLLVGVWSLMMAIAIGFATATFYPMDIGTRNTFAIMVIISISLMHFFHYWATMLIFDKYKHSHLIAALLLVLLSIFLLFRNYDWGWMVPAFMVGNVLTSIIGIITWKAYKQGDKAALVVSVSHFLIVLLFSTTIMILNQTIPIQVDKWILDVSANVGALAPLIAYAIYFSANFDAYRQSLQLKVTEIELISRERESELLRKNEELRAALLKGQTIERRRVATDLHDALGSTLSSLRWGLEGIDKNKLDTREQEVYHHVQSTINQAYDQVRLLSHNLLPQELEKQGLWKALDQLLEKMNRTTPVRFTLEVPDEAVRLEPKTEFELYSICLELVNNILRHSGATEAVIRLDVKEGIVELTVSDNGQGMSAANTPGRGLQNISDRVSALQGKWMTDTVEAGGTMVSVLVQG